MTFKIFNPKASAKLIKNLVTFLVFSNFVRNKTLSRKNADAGGQGPHTYKVETDMLVIGIAGGTGSGKIYGGQKNNRESSPG